MFILFKRIFLMMLSVAALFAFSAAAPELKKILAKLLCQMKK